MTTFVGPAYLGLATLSRDRFAFATGHGTLTTHPLEIGADGLWLNVDGNPEVVALDPSGRLTGRGKLGSKRRHSVYREVSWPDSPPAGRVSLSITLKAGDRLFSLGW